MKRVTDFFDLAVLEITNASEFARVDKLVVDRIAFKLVGFAVEDTCWYQGKKYLAFDKLIGIHEDVLTVNSQADVVQLKEEQYNELAATDVEVFLSRVITRKGSFIGYVEDFYIDDQGNIIAYEISKEDSQEYMLVDKKQVCSLGKDILVLVEDFEFTVLTVPEDAEQQELNYSTPAEELEEESFEPNLPLELQPVDGHEAEEQISLQDATNAIDEVVEEEEEDVAPEVQFTAPKAKEIAATEEQAPAAKIEDKQKQFILGKTSSKTIVTDNGVVIIEEGNMITEETIQRAKLAGKFMELLMNLQH
ncbi:PRC-barrel domain-containing protein [Succinispira mobilis]|uniref:PRC-barrel domain-containing protein n=1 Tax=Succinispira mobilis TaxID=78120 RepID=UPI0003719C2E|nr:PRC-barrel domain-containing protein [Succinispira mobilis]